MGTILLSHYLLIFATDQKQGFSSFESANNLIYRTNKYVNLFIQHFN